MVLPSGRQDIVARPGARLTGVPTASAFRAREDAAATVRRMLMNPEDARSDFILAGAVAVFGPLVHDLIVRISVYPHTGVTWEVLEIVWLVALTALVPYLLARYRDQGAEAYGLTGNRSALGAGLLIGVPIIVVAVFRGLVYGSALQSLLGRFATTGAATPAILLPQSAPSAALDLALTIVRVAALAVGATVLIGFLVTRSRDAFRQHDMSVVEGLRTFGMAAAGAALVLGLLTALANNEGWLSVLLHVAGLVAVILLVDRLIPPQVSTSRSTLLAPAIVVLLMDILAAGGFFQGNLLLGLYSGALACGLVFAVTALIEARGHAWAVPALLLITAVYPTWLTVLTPLRY